MRCSLFALTLITASVLRLGIGLAQGNGETDNSISALLDKANAGIHTHNLNWQMTIWPERVSQRIGVLLRNGFGLLLCRATRAPCSGSALFTETAGQRSRRTLLKQQNGSEWRRS